MIAVHQRRFGCLGACENLYFAVEPFGSTLRSHSVSKVLSILVLSWPDSEIITGMNCISELSLTGSVFLKRTSAVKAESGDCGSLRCVGVALLAARLGESLVL